METDFLRQTSKIETDVIYIVIVKLKLSFQLLTIQWKPAHWQDQKWRTCLSDAKEASIKINRHKMRGSGWGSFYVRSTRFIPIWSNMLCRTKWQNWPKAVVSPPHLTIKTRSELPATSLSITHQILWQLCLLFLAKPMSCRASGSLTTDKTCAMSMPASIVYALFPNSKTLSCPCHSKKMACQTWSPLAS